MYIYISLHLSIRSPCTRFTKKRSINLVYKYNRFDYFSVIFLIDLCTFIIMDTVAR